MAGSKRVFLIVAAIIAAGLLVVAVMKLRGSSGAPGATSASAETADEANRQRMLQEIERAANATPAPKEPDPSELPSIEEVLAEDDDGGDALIDSRRQRLTLLLRCATSCRASSS